MRIYLLFLIALVSPIAIAQNASTTKNTQNSSVNVQTIPQQVKTIKVNPSEDGYKLPKINNIKRYNRSNLYFDRLNRSYIIQTPFIAENSANQAKYSINPKYSLSNSPGKKKNKYPLIILFHAGGQSPEEVWEQTTLPEFAYNNNYYLVAPEGYRKQWNDGNKTSLPNEIKSYVDDVGFVMALIENLSENHAIDTSRVFVVGISNGGFMATHLACRTRDLIHGGVNMLSTLSYKDSRNCTNQAIPWLSINSGADKVVPFLGNIDGTNLNAEPLMSAEETFVFFSNKNRCMKISGYSQLPHFQHNDKTLGFIKVAENCHQGTKNVLLSFKDAGHQIPNIQGKSNAPFQGLSNQDIDPGTAIINFFNNNLELQKK